jgi:AGCS family alanine or glycine:cation symporter
MILSCRVLLATVLNSVEWLLTWPLILYTIGISLLFTIAMRFVQVRYFFASWQAIFPSEKKAAVAGEMTPLQAFINTLSTNLGNGSVMGAAVAVFTGGPGAALWVVLVGMVLMAIRFAEVFASTWYGARASKDRVLGGPMLYLEDVIGGKFLSMLYALLCLIFGLIVGNAMQTHSISFSVATTWQIDAYVSAIAITVFICYVVFGGAQRIIAVSDRIVPIKVLVFFGSAFLLLGYHSGALYEALRLIFVSAFRPEAFAGGFLGFTVLQALREGMNLSITATESGLGTAAILFGYTGSKDPMGSALMGMVSTFVSSIVCFIVALCIVVSGVWDSGLTSAALTIASFNTVFGQWGGWIVSFLSISFGIGVLVSYAYISRAAWFSLTNGKYEKLFALFYCAAAFIGAVVNVHAVWYAVRIINALLLTINLFGLLWLLPKLAREVRKRMKGA